MRTFELGVYTLRSNEVAEFYRPSTGSPLTTSRAICARLQQHGHEVLTTHLLADDVERAEAVLTERQVYQRDIDWLSRCDVLVAEASDPAMVSDLKQVCHRTRS